MKIEKVIKFYLLANTLKNKLRQGLIEFGVTKARLESVAEHVYGTCILAIAIDSEFTFNINIDRVVKMLVIHELDEIIIGDIPELFEKEHQEKAEKGDIAISIVLGDLIKKEEYEKLLREFNERKTDDAIFAYMCDKLEHDIQIKIYDEEGYCDLNNIKEETKRNPRVQTLISEGASSVSQIFNDFNKNRYINSEVFQNMLKYIKENRITELISHN